MEENSEQQPATPMPPPPQVPPQKQPPGLVGEVPPASREAMSPVQRGRGRGRNSGDGRGGSGRGGRSGRGRTGAGGRTIHDPNARGRGRGRNQPQNNQGTTQKIAPNTGIPFGHVPAYLPGSSSLVEELDQRSMVVLRDGRHIVGVSGSTQTKDAFRWCSIVTLLDFAVAFEMVAICPSLFGVSIFLNIRLCLFKQ